MEFAAWELTWVVNNKDTIKHFMDQEEGEQINCIDNLIQTLFPLEINNHIQNIINKATIFLKLLAKRCTNSESNSSLVIPQVLVYHFWVGYLYQSIFSEANRAQVLELGSKYLIRFISATKKELKRDKQTNSELLLTYKNYKHIIKNIELKADRERERKMTINLINLQASSGKLDDVIETRSFNNIDPKVLFLEALRLVDLIKRELSVLSIKPRVQDISLAEGKAAANVPHTMKVWRLNKNKDVEDVYLQNVNKRKMMNFDSEYYFQDRKDLKNVESFKSGKIFNAPNFTVEEAIDKEHNAAVAAGVPHACCDAAKSQKNKDERSFYFEDREDEENEENKRKVKMEWDELKDQPPKGRGR